MLGPPVGSTESRKGTDNKGARESDALNDIPDAMTLAILASNVNIPYYRKDIKVRVKDEHS